MILSRLRKPKVHIVRTFVQHGVRFAIQYVDRTGTHPVPLPATQQGLPLLRLEPKTLFRILLLDGLWSEGALTESHGAYVLPYAFIYEMEPELATALGIPPVEDVQVSLRTRSFVGSREFRIEATVHHPKYGPLPIHRRVGPAVPVGDQHVLLSEPVSRLLDAVTQLPSERLDQLRYVARVKKVAAATGAALDDYLAGEDYIFVDQLGIAPSVEPDGTIRVKPVLEDLPSEHADLHDELINNGYAIASGSPARRTRIFPSRESVQRAAQIQQAGLIVQGEDIPEFVGNPAAFIPEAWDAWDIDLEMFSERVKGLGIRTYTSKPYVTARRDSRGWFEVDVTLRVTGSEIDDTGDAPIIEADADLERKIADAQKQGKRWVQHGDGWIQVPSGALTLPEIRNRIRAVTQDEALPPSGLAYVLEIFDNIEDLEYSETLLDIINALTASTENIDPPPNPPFMLSLHPHQLDGYRWLRGRRDHRVGGLLADDMGLGKTIQVLAFIAYLAIENELTPSIVVVPRTLVGNWQIEINRACPSLRTYQHVGSGRLRDPARISRFDIVLTTYETLVLDQLLLGRIDWKLVVCDEAQYIRNYTTSRASAVKALKAQTRLALTGTPVENKLGDLWSIVDYAQPGLLGSYSEFRDRYEKPLELGTDDVQGVERRLLANIAPVYLRRTKEDHVSLPPKDVLRHPVPFSDEQQSLYLEVIRRYLQNPEKGQGLAAIQRLLQICSHPYLPDPVRASTESVDKLSAVCPKLATTLEILASVQRAGEKAVVFTHYRFMQAILQRVISARFGLWPQVINGDSSQRVETVSAFNRSKGFDVLILSTRAAGVGLNISGANHVIHYTRWWNPAQEKQATDRVHRLGQTKPVFVHLPIVTDPAFPNGTAEQRLDELLQEKERVARSVIVPSSSLNVTAEELQAVLRL